MDIIYKMSVLFYIKGCHHKIVKNMIKGFKLINIDVIQCNNISMIYKLLDNNSNITHVYCPNQPLDINKYPNIKFVFGPQFSILPDNKSNIKCDYNNAIYIQPSQWCVNMWKICKYTALPLKSYCIGVDTEEFKPIDNNNSKKTIFIYYKSRSKKTYEMIINFINTYLRKEYKIEIIKYGSYNEKHYKEVLNNSIFGIWLGSHESQGLALEEALSMNVPLLVWNVKSICDEVGSTWSNKVSKEGQKLATSIPYWDERCGEYFYEEEELYAKYVKIIEKISKKEYSPRQFILDNLALEKRAKAFFDLI